MTFAFGIKPALDYSVFAVAAAAFALSTMHNKHLEIDNLFYKKRQLKKATQMSGFLFFILAFYYASKLAPLAATLLSILRINPCNTLPGPTSINSVPPSAIILCIDCVQRTGAVN